MNDKNDMAGKVMPVIAGIAVLAAISVVLFVPKDKRDDNGNAADEINATAGDETIEKESGSAITVEDGKIIVAAAGLSQKDILFFKPIEDKKIELLARKGDDGKAKVALGTCQSCNGAPGAFYSQKGSELQCNNCGLTFPVTVLDSPGGGCHPIMLDESIVEYRGDDAVIDTEGLASYESLFDKVIEH